MNHTLDTRIYQQQQQHREIPHQDTLGWMDTEKLREITGNPKDPRYHSAMMIYQQRIQGQ